MCVKGEENRVCEHQSSAFEAKFSCCSEEHGINSSAGFEPPNSKLWFPQQPALGPWFVYGIFPPVFEKPMCLASGVVPCPVLPHKHPSLILPLGVRASPSRFPSPSGCSCSVPSFPVPSPGPGVCVHQIPARPPCPFVSRFLLLVQVFVPAVLGCDGPSFESAVHPSNTHPCFPVLPFLRGCYFRGRLSSRGPYSSEEIRAVCCCGGARDVPLL